MWVVSCGIIFQVPVLSYGLSKAGFLTPLFLRTYRKHAIILCLVLAAFLTPPDPISQVLIAIPLVILYEIAIGVSEIAVRQRTKELRKAFSEE